MSRHSRDDETIVGDPVERRSAKNWTRIGIWRATFLSSLPGTTSILETEKKLGMLSASGL